MKKKKIKLIKGDTYHYKLLSDDEEELEKGTAKIIKYDRDIKRYLVEDNEGYTRFLNPKELTTKITKRKSN